MHSNTHNGYGIALLIVFVASSILLVASMSLMIGPGTAMSMGSVARDNAIAKQIALIGLEAAQNDILDQLKNGIAITTAYRYPTSNTNAVSMPPYPNGIGGNTVGNYYVTVTKARGYTYMLQATATVNNNVTIVSKLAQLRKNSSIPTGAYAAYSLRKLFPSYAGSAVKVRCAATGLTQDIGFNSNGDFDIAALRTCMGDGTLPLDVDTGAKLAYGLRKLSSSYTGYAMRVQSSASGTPEKDIGFDANGNLDISSLKSFLGTNSGYIKTWYDQSGNGKDLTQTSASKRPRIAYNGKLDSCNNAPAIYFDGTDDYLDNTTLGGTLITGAQLRSFIVSSVESGSNTWGRFAVLWKSGDSNAYSTPTSMELLLSTGSLGTNGTHLNVYNVDASGILTGTLYQHTSYHDASNNLRLYRNGSLAASTTVSASLAPTDIVLGTGAGPDAGVYSKAYIDELIIFNSDLSLASQQAIEKNQGHYYNIPGMTDGFITTWYDQSGNSRDLTQTSTSAQPVIDTTGYRPAVYIDVYGCSVNFPSTIDSANCDFLEKSGLNTTISPMTMTTFGVGRITPNAQNSYSGRFISLYKTSTSDNNNASSVVPIMKQAGSSGYIGTNKHEGNNPTITVALNYGEDFQATSLGDGANRSFRNYQSSSGLLNSSNSTYASESVTINTIRMGINDGLNTNVGWDGLMYESIVYTNTLDSSRYQSVETNERNYYGL